MTTWKIALGITAVLVLTIAACGGGPPDAVKVYSEAGDNMAALASYHLTTEFQQSGNDESLAHELDLMLPDAYQATFFWGLSYISIGEETFTQVTGSPDWFVYPQGVFEAPLPDFIAFGADLFTRISDLTYVAEEAVDGVSTYHLQGNLPPEVVAILGDDVDLTESRSAELWIGTKDRLMHRLRWTEGTVGEDQGTVTLTFSRFDDKSISVATPPNPRPAEDMIEERLFTRFDVREGIKSLSAEQQDCLGGVLGERAFGQLKFGLRMPTVQEFQKA